VVVLAPFIGGYFINDAIEKVGGLHKWENCPLFEWDYACDMWKLLKDYLSDSENQGKVILGYGTEDGFANGNRLLSEQLLPENVFTVPGGHDWMTWKLLWIKVLDYFHVSRKETDADSCLIEVNGSLNGWITNNCLVRNKKSHDITASRPTAAPQKHHILRKSNFYILLIL
jgi:hypothetical protein